MMYTHLYQLLWENEKVKREKNKNLTKILKNQTQCLST